MRLNHSEKGQAVLEYLLILIVGFSLILAVFRLNHHFKNFAQAYLGNYFSCLIQAGEIPSLGGGDKTKEQLGQSCDAQFKKFSLAHGKALKESFPTSSNKKDREKSKPSKAIGGSRVKPDDRSMFPRKKRYSKKRAKNAKKSKPVKKSSSVSDLDQQKGRFAYKGVKKKRFRKKGNQIVIEEVIILRDKKEKKERINIVNPKNEKRAKSKSQYIEFRKIAKTELENQEEGQGWNIRSIFKFLIVVAFIIALFFLIGGQLLKISKDSD